MDVLNKQGWRGLIWLFLLSLLCVQVYFHLIADLLPSDPAFPTYVGWRLAMVLGDLLQLALVYRMAQNHFPKPWLWLFLAFLWLVDMRAWVAFPEAGAGLTALLAVFMVWLHLKRVYAGEVRIGLLIVASLFTALTSCFSLVTGLFLALGIAFFSWFHCFLHEREERGVSYGKVSRKVVCRRWLRFWGFYWLLPLLLFYFVGLGFLAAFRLWPVFLEWLSGPTTAAAGNMSVIGYFSSFHWEFTQAFEVAPTLNRMPEFFRPIFQTLNALRLLAIGVLPVVGILGIGYQLPNRFVYRLLQRPDEELLLFWSCGTALILSTFWASNAMRIVSVGALSFLLGFLVLVRWLKPRPKAEREAYWLFAILCFLWWISDIVRDFSSLP